MHHHLPRPDPSWWHRRPRRRCTQAHDAVPEPATTSSSLSPRCCAPDTVPKPTMSSTHVILGPIALSSSPSPWCRRPMPSSGPQHHRPPRARDTVVPATSLSPRCRQTCAIPKPTTPSSSPSPAMLHVYFSLSFYAYKSWFWYATLPHCFDMLHCL
jgi:hypothetical protein